MNRVERRRGGQVQPVPLCNICRAAPCARDGGKSGYKRHCGSAACIEATTQGLNHVGWRGWPRVTAEDTADFAAHNIAAGDGGPFRMNRPDARSLSSSSADWAVRA
jgi:hypothetical protein